MKLSGPHRREQRQFEEQPTSIGWISGLWQMFWVVCFIDVIMVEEIVNLLDHPTDLLSENSFSYNVSIVTAH